MQVAAKKVKLPHIITDLPGPKAREIVEQDHRVVSPSYTRDYPLVAKSGRGAIISDVDGNEFLDFAAAAQVRRQGVPVVAEAAEVDNPLQPGPRTRLAECRGSSGILALEVRVGERVHEVVGHLQAGHRGA